MHGFELADITALLGRSTMQYQRNSKFACGIVQFMYKRYVHIILLYIYIIYIYTYTCIIICK